ncbi:rhodanese-like domain-containing protein [Candidatus Persebacteraceae bacterium Df01]|jgi:rhodanese-related sulfurtransferase|uniref:Rhodanese-like domain-containing protein n=1 Tax=Candidatus Doriopsillibacter californiensis TaxID=2970740 RepID=A0ABT7QN31_9GAMM|nr:rhodanese-like domain-containing protein [Candidatus Persebacteraceae bacterium Df01]
MTTAKQALAAAVQRKQQLDLPYAGALTPDEAHTLWQEEPQAMLVDVRTIPEMTYVGRVPNAVAIQWQFFPDMTVNEAFLDELKKIADVNQPVMFLCRSGVRSHYAATVATEAGYCAAFNILEGFEGELDTNGHRGKINGWRCRRLPWVQS